MSKLACEVSKRIMAVALSIAMIMSNMTVYAADISQGTGEGYYEADDEEKTETAAEESSVSQVETTSDKDFMPEEAGKDEQTSDEDSQISEKTDEVVPETEQITEEVSATDKEDEETSSKDEDVKAAAHTLWVVGDSTACSYIKNGKPSDTTYYYPRYGYATQIENYLDDTYSVQNLALSGRSSKSFLSESNYTTLKNGIKAGDILVIAWGHNDEKAGATFTSPSIDNWETNEDSFAYHLYNYYIKVAEDKGATAILCTPIVRRTSGTSFSDSQLHVTSDGNYPAAIKKVGEDKNIPVVDMTTLTKDLYLGLGADETKYLHAWTTSTKIDDTHLNLYGAKVVAQLFAQGVKDLGNSTDLSGHIINETDTIDKTKTLEEGYNQDYKDAGEGYNPPADDVKSIWDDYTVSKNDKSATFKGTVFGDVAGQNNIKKGGNFTLEEDKDGNMHIAAKNNCGKIGSGSDGLAMYYYRVPATAKFTLTAKAVLNSFDANGQVAFGLMARDDMYIDTYINTLLGDYVVAGSRGTGTNCYYRKSGSLGGSGTLSKPLAAGNAYDLKLVGTGEGFQCTFGTETTQSGGYDYMLTSVDEEYIYIGMFAARNADVTFNNIYLQVEDEVIVDARNIEYDVTVESAENGTVTANKISAAEGETVTFTATPDNNYMFKEYQVTYTEDGTEKTDTITDNQFTMPASDVTVKAFFETPIRAEWNFETDSTLIGSNGMEREGKTFYVAGLAVDTTKSGSKWDSTGTSGGVSVTKDTVINIPAAAGDYALVEISASTADYTVDFSQDATDGNGSFYCPVGNASGVIRLEITDTTKIKSIKVTPDVAYTPEDTSGKIDVWDFGAKEEENTAIYNNNITAAGYKKTGYISSSGTFSVSANTAIPFGDLTMTVASGDRLYTEVASLPSAGTNYNGKTIEDYTSGGAWYSNGTGGSNRRCVTISNVQAGDKIVAYLGNASTTGVGIIYNFAGQGTASAQNESMEEIAAGGNDKNTFIAKYDGTYKIYAETEPGGKPLYYRIMRIPTVTVSGTINLNGNNISNYGLRFINQTDKTLPDIVATVNSDGTFVAELSAGYTYRALLTGVTGYGIVTRNNADKVTTTNEEAVTGKQNVVFTVESQETYTYSGKIEGFASDYDVSNLAITMEPTADFDTNAVDLTIDKAAMTFSAELEPNVKYTFTMEGVNDYEVKTPSYICNENQSSYVNQTITVVLKPMYEVRGGFILPEDVTVTSLTLTNVEDNYPYKATVADGGYSINLRDGEYVASAVVSDTNYSTRTHVIVDGGAVSRDLLFVSSAKESIDYVADIYVGYPKQAHNYKTVSEAVEAASLMKKGGNARTDADRVIIHIAPGTYREQIIVNTPYVSFVNDTDEEVLLTWYYGIGYMYYSADANGFYNAENAYDKYEKNGGTDKDVSRWGCSVRLYGATGFRAEGITFENSFNRYITDEEIEDGVEPDRSENSKNFARNYGSDVKSRAATERAAAVVIENNTSNLEFYNCKFYSSQDTLYTSGGPAYFKNCLIEGQTDYIYGSGSCVFDACELSWKGYSVGAQGGYITANSPRTTGDGDAKVRADDDLGYLFRNCTVTANTGLPVVAGYFGRPWGKEARVIFMNTKLQNTDMIAAAGWTAMSSVDPTKVHVDFCEYKTTSLDGKAVVTTSRTNEQMTDAEAAAIDVEAYFGGLESWTPVHYTPDATGTVTFSADPSLTDNGDINKPNPGHTLTVEYSLGKADDENDVSTIKWYIVDDTAGTNPVLEKISTASVDKTYKITKAASGKYIKVEVTPETVDGRTGEAKSVILEEVIGTDYVDPSSGSNITIGEGINVYLAGDSTVKDYSAKGMWNGGTQSEDLGSWGEYLQSFFDEKEVTVQNFAQGGRSSRSFINDDTTNQKKYSVIEENIGEGDYLFIQFGHNDSSIAENKKDVYTPIGAKGSDGKYPYTKGEKNADGKYPDYYTYSGGTINWNGDGTATYCWFLQQYVDMALEAGAIPVIMSPVARMQYSSTGNKTHHADEGNTSSYYWEAAKQVYEDNKDRGVLFIDAYGLTTELFNGAYEDGGEPRGKEIMSISDGTHNNKLGGMVEAMLVAEAIQKMDTTLAYAVKAPAQVSGMTTAGKTVFSIDSSSKFTAYEQKFTGNKENAAYTDDTFTTKSTYWSDYGNAKLAAIGKKAGDLADNNVSDSATAAPKAATETNDDGTQITITLTSATDGAKIYYTDDGVTNPKGSNGDPVNDAQEYNDTKKIVITEDTIIKAYAKAEGKTASRVVTFNYVVTPDIKAPTASKESGSAVAKGTVITLETATSDAEIRYTMGNNPADPTKYSTIYKDGITIINDTTIKAIAVKNGIVSEIATFVYTIDATQGGITVKPLANPATGATVGLKYKITLSSSTPDASIYYTTDGTTTPSATETDKIKLYSGGIEITEDIITKDPETEIETVVIKVIAVCEGMTDSSVETFTYTVDRSKKVAVSAPTADPVTGSTLGIGDTVTLRSITKEAKIRYTTDGSDPKGEGVTPTESPSPVTITITESMVKDDKVTIMAYAVCDDMADSDAVAFNYTIDRNKKPVASVPTAEPATESKLNIGDTVTLESTTEGAKIRYTTDGSDPKAEGVTPTESPSPVTIEITESMVKDGKVTIKAYAVCDSCNDSETETFVYTVESGSSEPGLVIKLNGYDKYENGEYYYTYTGSAITPSITVYYDGRLLTPTTDYTVKYTNNVNAAKSDIGKKAPAVTVTGKGNFGKAKTVNFTISQKNLADEDIVGKKILVLDGSKAKTSDLTLYYGGIKLAYNKNFVIDTDDAATPDLGTNTTWSDKAYKIAVKAKENGNFSGSTKIDVIAINKETQKNNALVVKPADSSKLKLKYNGAANTPATGDLGITNKSGATDLVEGTDYVISYPKDTTNVGTKKFTVKGISAKCIGTVTKSYSIIPDPEGTGLTVSLNLGNDNSKAFNGTSVTLGSSELVVKYNTTTLKEGTDYKVAYGNNKKISDKKPATYKITFLGNYKGVKKVGTGSMNGEFTITAAALNENTATVVIPDKVVKENSKEGVYTSVPYVTLNNGVLLKKSDYTVSYLVNGQVMDKNNKAGIGSTIIVKITGKGNYAEETTENLILTTTYKVVTGTDLSKAKVEFYDSSDADAKNKNKLSYTGSPIVPSKVVINGTDYSLCEDEGNTGVYQYKDTDNKKFNITYANNIYKGKATAVITPGEGNTDYVGGKTATFSIVVRTFGQ